MFAREQRARSAIAPSLTAAKRAPADPCPQHSPARTVCPCGGGCSRCATSFQSPAAEATLEREAQEAAAHVAMSSPLHGKGHVAPPRLSRVSASHDGPRTFLPASEGRQLDPGTLRDFELRFGTSLSHACIHTGQQAARAADDLHARAYTFGNHIVFGEGQFAPQTAAGRGLLAHELAHVVQHSSSSPVIQRQPKGKSPLPERTYSQFQPADQVVDLTRDQNDDWEITLSGHISEQSAQRAIWPSRLPFGVKITLLVALTDPIEQGLFKLSGITFKSLSTMEPSIAKLFIAHGLEDETKERPDVVAARADFREEHSGHGDWVLDAIDVALKRATRHNPDLLVAYYRYYAQHKLSDPTWWDRNMRDFDRDKTAGQTVSGGTAINPGILRLEPPANFKTDDPLSLLGETLIHEYVHTPQGDSSNAVAQAPGEAKAYAVELFFAERAGDKSRAELIEKRYVGTDPLDLATSGNQIYARTYRILSELYKAIDAGGPAAEKARKMSVDFISHNEEDYGPDLRQFIQNLSSTSPTR
jgi:Domain of unknown function (DUF4157)